MATKRKAPAKASATKALARRQQTEALAKRPPDEPGMLGVFGRLARDPNLTVDKLGELIKLQERIIDREAVTAFDAAYRVMLPEIPRISKRGKILNKSKEVQSRYSKYEDIRRVCDPILRRHDFTFHTQTVWPATGVLEVIGILEHGGGGKRESRFRTTADESGGKNAIQGLGSGVSYGKRYTLKDLLSIVEEGEDDDGQTHGTKSTEPEPARRAADPPAGHDRESREQITKDQARRLTSTFERSGRSQAEVKVWLDRRYGWQSMAQITRDRYEEICRAIEAPGDLPL
jgi:hypothetical protein